MNRFSSGFRNRFHYYLQVALPKIAEFFGLPTVNIERYLLSYHFGSRNYWKLPRYYTRKIYRSLLRFFQEIDASPAKLLVAYEWYKRI